MDKLSILKKDHPTVRRESRTLNFKINAGELRTGTIRDEEFSIVDIIAILPNIVIRAMGSDGPEYVPGDIHKNNLHAWANRPVVLDHPVDDNGKPVSANSPEVLEAYQFGHVFEPKKST